MKCYRSFKHTVIAGMVALLVSTLALANGQPEPLSPPMPNENLSFYLRYSNVGLTCAEQDVTVLVMRNGTLVQDFNGTIQLSAAQDGNNELTWLNADGTRLSNNRYTFTDADHGQVQLKLSKASEGLVTLSNVSLLNTQSKNFELIPSISAIASGGGHDEDEGMEDLLPMYFYGSGFKITYPDSHLAGQEFNLTIEAVTSGPDGSCQRDPSYYGSHQIEVRKTQHQQFDEAYLNELRTTKVLFPGRPSATNFIALSDDTLARNYTLNFGEGSSDGGIATLKVRYDGIGIFSFHAGDLMTGLYGESNPIAITPAKLNIKQVVIDKNGPVYPEPTLPRENTLPGVFATAGENFEVEVEALNAEDQPILGFGHERPREDLSLSFERILPAEGVDGVLSVCWQHLPLDTPSCEGVVPRQINGASSSIWATVKYDEVGHIRLIASMQDGQYWQQEVPQEALVSAHREPSHTKLVGRFIPAKIVVSDSKVAPKFSAACAVSNTEGFTYLGQPIVQSNAAIPTVIIKAENLAGGILKNYTEDLWRLESDFHPTLENLAAVENTELMHMTVTTEEQAKDNQFNAFLRSESLISGDESAAGYSVFKFLTPVNLQYTKPEGDQLIAPFEAKIRLNYYLKEKDGVLIYRPNQEAPLAVEALPSDKSRSDVHWAKFWFGSAEEGIEFLSGKTMYQGRLYLSNASRAALLPMQMPLMVQYYNGQQFVRNTKDNCTVFNTAPQIIEASFENQERNLDALSRNYASNLSMSGDKVDARFTDGNRMVKVDNAAYTQHNEAPPPYGYMIIRLPIEDSHSWLRFPWTEERNYPEARASIGIWEGDAPVIFKSEYYIQPH